MIARAIPSAFFFRENLDPAVRDLPVVREKVGVLAIPFHVADAHPLDIHRLQPLLDLLQRTAADDRGDFSQFHRSVTSLKKVSRAASTRCIRRRRTGSAGCSASHAMTYSGSIGHATLPDINYGFLSGS